MNSVYERCDSIIERLVKTYGADGISTIILDLIDRIKYPSSHEPLSSEKIEIIKNTSTDLQNALVLCQSQFKMGLLINEGGINWRWLTRIRLNPEGTVTILEHYRKYLQEYWTDDERRAMSHPKYYGAEIWEESPDRTALKYHVPGIGWTVIVNPKNIFSYGGPSK